MAQSLSNLAVGAKIKFGKYSVNGETPQDISWVIVAKNHQCEPAYPTNSVTLITDKIIDIRAFDAKEPNSGYDNVQRYGRSVYKQSNIDQWLNSDALAGQWYSAQHEYDEPPKSGYVSSGSEYDNRPGFLNAFSTKEKDVILTTTIKSTVADSYSSGGYIERKVFLPSRMEVGYGMYGNKNEGETWGCFVINADRLAYLTTQAFENTKFNNKPNEVATPMAWWLRTPTSTGTHTVQVVASNGSVDVGYCANEASGVRPVINLPLTTTVGDTVDSDGCYVVDLNVAPTVPASIDVPSSVYGGRANAISWSPSVDVDGDVITYELECAYGDGAFSSIYAGISTTYNHTILFGETSVQYRVRAVDSNGSYSGYMTSAPKNIINNNPPVVSGSDGNIGVKTEGFCQEYSVTDIDGDTVTITETIDNEVIRTYSATLGATNNFAVTDTTWLKLANGSHSMTITATDIHGDKSIRNYIFVKSVTSCSVQTNPMSASGMPSLIWVTVVRSVPTGAIFNVEVCNNGYDPEPTWEDATSAVIEASAYQFTNVSKTADNWAVRVRVTVDRNGAEGACYISSIGGNFE